VYARWIGAEETFIHLWIRYVAPLDWISVPTETPGVSVAIYTGDYELRKLTVGWSRTPTAGVVQDLDMCTFHFLKLTSGNPDNSWVTSDYTTVEGAFDTAWTTLASSYPPELKLASYIWRADGPGFKPHGGSLSPTLRITPKSIAGSGTASAALPPQCAMSVTEVTEAHYTAFGVGVPGHTPGTGRTQVRNRWGRFYLPPMAPVNLTDGRWSSGACTLTANNIQTFYNACVAAHLVPVMYSPTTGNSWSIIEIRVDDIVDVIRSRRYVTPITRAPKAINAPT